MSDGSGMSERKAVEAFLDEFLEDLRSGRPKPLDHYTARAPEHAAAIRAEYEPLVASAGEFRRTEGATADATAHEAPPSTRAESGGSSGTFFERFGTGLSAGGGSIAGSEAAIPQRIAHYLIEEEVGRGGMGVVYRAKDERLGRQVALKVLNVPVRHDTYELLLRFRREAEIASRLDHPNICSVHDAGMDAGLSWIAMRWVEGIPLSRALAQARALTASGGMSGVDLSVTAMEPGEVTGAGPRSDSRARALVLETIALVEKVARALHEAHEAGVVHRDVKPANIMVTRTREPVVLDFGVARLEEGDDLGLTREGDRVGTPAYMSPEQINGEMQQVDRRTDVWGLGVLLHELVTLKQPFAGATRDALASAILHAEPEDARRLNRAVSRELATVIITALEKNPERRYHSAFELAEDLRRIREHEPIHARPVPLRVRIVRWAQRRPGSATAVAAGFLLVVGAIVAQQMLLSSEKEHTWALTRTNNLLEEQRSTLSTQKSRIEELADTRDLRRLTECATRGWRALPASLAGEGGMTNWLVDAERLLVRREGHVRTLEELLRPDGGPERALPERDMDAASAEEHAAFVRARARALVGRARNHEASDGVRAWRMEAIAAHLEDLEKLEAGVLPRVKKVADLAGRVERETFVDAAELWRKAAERVRAQPRYSGLGALRPQLGLIPLGPDPATGLEEFAHLQSGIVPVRDAVNGQLLLDNDAALIFVLLGHSEFVMGAERAERDGMCDGTNLDVHAEAREAPAHSVRLDPYFISKYEMTQAQWERATATTPSFYKAGMVVRTGVSPTPLHPVESVTATEADHALALLGLALPTEAQWENAARGRADSRDAAPWWCGTRAALAAAANLADLTLQENGGPPEANYEDWHDGYVVHAPILGRVANSFGLHDMLGNVAELCADSVADYSIEPAAGQGLRLPSDEDVSRGRANRDNRVLRGGGFLSSALRARTTRRDFQSANKRESFCGIRPVRSFD